MKKHRQRTVDLDDLLIRVEDDRDLLCELIGIFKEEFPPLLQSLQKSVAGEDIKSVEDSSHALKGILSGLSVTRAAALASRLEQIAHAGETSGLADTLALLEIETADLLTELGGYTNEAKS